MSENVTVVPEVVAKSNTLRKFAKRTIVVATAAAVVALVIKLKSSDSNDTETDPTSQA